MMVLSFELTSSSVTRGSLTFTFLLLLLLNLSAAAVVGSPLNPDNFQQQAKQHQQQQQQLTPYAAAVEEEGGSDGHLTPVRFPLEDQDEDKQSGGLGEYLAGENSNGQQQQWEMVLDPKFYIHTERERIQRKRRNAGPSLSIVNPLDVLRQRLLIEIARRRFHSKNQQINLNTEYLSRIGR